ncbi:MAG TPA: hypothetical protein VJ813_10850 [Vicinamibacterales bacterium]|nr:hypothetical protein [Vicinamibacterales bacterium]
MAPDAVEIELDPGGRIRFHGRAEEWFSWLDTQLEQLALRAGAAPVSPPAVMPRAILDQAGYFEAFPEMAIPAHDDEGDAFLAPAACYHVYSTLQGRRLDGPYLVTLATTCGRQEVRTESDAGRLRRFRMREVVFVGPAAWVAATRDEWMAKAGAFAASIGLAGTMEQATDTFFGQPGRGRRLIQQIKQLKYELRMEAGAAGQVAAASFNLHESFFASRFDIRMADGSPAASGCAAFGIERWTLARLAQAGDGAPPT